MSKGELPKKKPLAHRIEEVLKDCLYRDEELPNGEMPADAIIVQGILSRFAFHPGRIAAHKGDIAAFCNELPDQFQKLKGGGWSFLNLCRTKDGVQWGEHRNCEQLVVLAIGSGQGGYPMPRNTWSMLPGAVPYVYFDTQP